MTHEKKRIPINNHDAPRDKRAPVETPPAEEDVSPDSDVEAAAEAADAQAESGDFGGGLSVSEEQPSPGEVLEAERDGYLDALKRLQAEFDNYRRRSQRESSEARARARAGLLTEFLPVFDNLARALDAAEHHEEGKVLEGVRLTHNLFADLLVREGVQEIHPLGTHFDPHLHEAIVSMPSDAEEGVVVQVVEKGYTAGESVLRPARVVVSSGSPAPEAQRES